MDKVTDWELASVRGHVFCAPTLSVALIEAAHWIEEAYEGDEAIYSVLGITLYEDDESYSVQVFVE